MLDTREQRIKRLEELGFKLEIKCESYVGVLGNDKDRFTTAAVITGDELDELLTVRYKLNGVTVISENEILKDHNELHTAAKNDYIEIKKKLPFLKIINK